MIFGMYLYLITILADEGTILVIEIAILRKELRKYVKFLAVAVSISILVTLILEPAALASRSWIYNPQYMFNVHIFGSEIETFLYSAFWVLIVSIATLVLAKWEEKGRKRR